MSPSDGESFSYALFLDHYVCNYDRGIPTTLYRTLDSYLSATEYNQHFQGEANESPSNIAPNPAITQFLAECAESKFQLDPLQSIQIYFGGPPAR